MNQINTVIKIFAIVLKYSAVLLAVVKGIEVVNEELQKINLNDKKQVNVD